MPGATGAGCTCWDSSVRAGSTRSTSTSRPWSSWRTAEDCRPDRVLLHAFTDGRDTPPRSAAQLMPALEARLAGRATVATVSGRYYAMDRDQRWDRTARAWEAIVHGAGPTSPSATEAVTAAHARGEGDEFIVPTVIDGYDGMRDGDAVVHLNFRADRARQLTQALALDDFAAFDRGRRPADLLVATLTEYQAPDELPVPVAFPPVVVDSLAAYLSRLGMRQLHLAETEKYAHVTYFFNGGVEAPAARRGSGPGAVAPRRADLRPGAGDERAGDHRAAAGRHRLRRLRLHHRQLCEPGHGRPHRRVGGGAWPRPR